MSHRNVELLQDLIAQSTGFVVPEMRHPYHGFLLLFGFGSVSAVNEEIGVNEEFIAHGDSLVLDKPIRTLLSGKEVGKDNAAWLRGNVLLPPFFA